MLYMISICYMKTTKYNDFLYSETIINNLICMHLNNFWKKKFLSIAVMKLLTHKLNNKLFVHF